MNRQENRRASLRIFLSLVAALLSVLMLSSCIKYFPREEQTSATESTTHRDEVTTERITEQTTAVGDIPNLPQDDATKRY
jgi:hypothetical protein